MKNMKTDNNNQKNRQVIPKQNEKQKEKHEKYENQLD